jgi:ribosome-associated protein
MKKNEIRAQVAIAVKACHDKKAENITVLQLDEQSSGFTDYFIVCSGSNPRQVQAIADEIDKSLSAAGVEPKHTEGYNQAEWLLMDYVDFVVHIFSENARKFYDLERLWKTAKRIEPAELLKPAAKKAPAKRTGAKTGAKAAKKKTAAKKRAPAKRKSS